ncbi:MAG: acyltransferase [Flavobacterium sp.]|nr:MAG: acyltransferase [Flavobacterium sp.]
MKRMIIQFFLFFLPWALRRRALNSLFKYQIHKEAKIGFSFVLSDELIMDAKASIKSMTIVKNINRLKLGYNSRINSLNFITGMNMRHKRFLYDEGAYCELVVGNNSRITTRHMIDCNGGVYIGDFTTIAGYKTQFLSHSIDVYISRQTAGKIEVGDYCFVSTSCILLKGSKLPSYSVLAAGSVLGKNYSEEYALYGGVPAKKIKDMDRENTLYFTRTNPDVH